MKSHEPSANERCANGSGFDKFNPTASGWVGMSLGGFWVSAGASVGRVVVNGWETDERMEVASDWVGFPAAGSGFRRARLWGERKDEG
jgi:hypothetical protein